jgi:protocatechuate 3,4-dioxygenase beta subunit
MTAIMATLAALVAAAPAPAAQLDGAVTDEQGKPVAGATVFLYTAAPKKGVGVL